MRTTLLMFLLILALASPASAVTWEVEYFIRGDVSQPTPFFGDGAYEFLWTPNYTAAYLHETNWIFLGLYGEAVLPADLPPIVFPVGFDAAVASPSNAVPEPAVLILVAMGIGGTIMRLRKTGFAGAGRQLHPQPRRDKLIRQTLPVARDPRRGSVRSCLVTSRRSRSSG